MKTYLSVPEVDLARAVSLGAERDSATGQLFVPAGRSLTPFQGWLPAEVSGRELMIPADRGASLSELLSQVSRAVQAAFTDAVWVRLEVADVKMRNGGHLYIDAVERDASGKQLAKASAIVWSSRFSTVMKKLAILAHPPKM